MKTPTARERKSLGCLVHVDWEYEGKIFGAGPKTIKGLLENGWMKLYAGEEFIQGVHIRYCITDAGREAFALPKAKGSTRQRGLKPARPLLAELKSRI